MAGATRRLSVLDSTFLRIETDNTPMHVGALMTFEVPERAAPGFVADVVERFRGTTPLRRPFNQVLAEGVLSPVLVTLRVTIPCGTTVAGADSRQRWEGHCDRPPGIGFAWNERLERSA